MSCSAGPKINLENTLLCVDASNIKSYPGTGSVLYDLVGPSTDITVTAGTTFLTDNLGCVYFDTAGEIGSASGVLTGAINTTWEAWVNLDASTNTYNMFMGAYPPYYAFNSGNRFYFSIITGGVQRALSTPTNKTAGQWYHTATTVEYDGTTNTTIIMYTNGVQDATAVQAGAPSYNGAVSLGEGRVTPSWYPFKGKMGPCKVYSRALSADEVLQNFNAHRSRFGI